MDRKHQFPGAPRQRADDNLNEALSGPSAEWIEAALAQAGSGEEVLLAAIDAAVLATALARRAVAYLEQEAVRRAAAEGAPA